MINPLSINPWKKTKLKITKSWCVKEEVVRSFGKQSTYKSSSIKHNFSKRNTPQNLSELLVLNTQSSPVVLKLQKRKNRFSSRSSFKSSPHLPINDYSVDLLTDRDQSTCFWFMLWGNFVSVASRIILCNSSKTYMMYSVFFCIFLFWSARSFLNLLASTKGYFNFKSPQFSHYLHYFMKSATFIDFVSFF